jgi:hypothetical protein
MGGVIFNWLRMVYKRMAYYVKHGDMQSAEFKAFIGLLNGDPASPILWNLFLAELMMMPDKDDVFLTAVQISLLAQADNRQTTCFFSPYLPVGFKPSLTHWSNGSLGTLS